MMNQPKTIYDVLVMLADYHELRSKKFEQLVKASVDSRASILLEHLVELETHSMHVVRAEMEQLTPEHSTYLISGPTLSTEAIHASECCCEGEPSFNDVLACASASDQRLDELLDRIEDFTAAPSVIELAKRLRDLQQTKDIQISNFTRED
ncbi:hypothetical protein [Rhodopirellula baltica]|uniref:Uncharacterized protein n=1 Tax=Rhodopirellula baltica WH47 TaxID=991778 RepID=F2B138_RHOBT|nr:hypothetical protein [Rhodopirellula baltica]EGF24390.1 hypothetical protein RBWH47_02935 [Rhodopirellula baltica WH47]